MEKPSSPRIELPSSWREDAQRLHREERSRHHLRMQGRSRRKATFGAMILALCLAFVWLLARLG